MPMPFSPAGTALGLNNLGRTPGLGDALGDQVGDETDLLRKKRMPRRSDSGRFWVRAAARLRRPRCLVRR